MAEEGRQRELTRALRELEGVHRALIATHPEKSLKSDRVLRELRRMDA